MLLARVYSAYFVLRRDPIRIAIMSATGALTLLMNTSAFAAPLDPSGLWSTKDDESIIRIGPCAPPPGIPPVVAPPGAPTPSPVPPYCGTLVWMKDPLEKGLPKTDTQNPDREKRKRPLIGLELLTELSAEADHWKGKAYNADDGKIYDITFKVVPDKLKGDKGEIRGCVLRILCQSETFTKVQAVPGGDPTLTPAPAYAVPSKVQPAPASPHAH
jgi:uncharacterized protein (DUF2147 family)